MATTLNKIFPDLSKLEPLDGNNYKRWSQKLLIFFEQLEVDYVLFNKPPANVVADSSNANTIVVDDDDDAKKKFENDNKTVRGHLLNHMSNPLFYLFINYKSAKVIWDSLEKKYGVDNAGKKKYVVRKWIKFQMVDDKPIMEQFHEYENLTADVLNEGTKMCDILQANVLFEKFPPSWSDYRNQLKHKKKNITLQELIRHMRTEEANLQPETRTKYGGKAPVQANLTECDDFIAFEVVDANMVANKTDWVLDTDASRHIYANKELFHDFEESADSECVYMGNSTTARVMESKHTKKPFKNVTSRKTELLELVHSDLTDFKNTVSKGGKKYYITFADDFSRYTKNFFEHIFPLKNNVPNNASTSMSVNSHIVPSSSVTANEHENELRRSKRHRIEASFGPDFITIFLTENIYLDVLNDELASIYLIEEDPKTYNEAMRSIGCKPISSKWIFKKKLRPDGTIEKYKGRLVIGDFNQKKGIDYFDTYSHVTKIMTIRALVALASINNFVIHQMDVKTAFLNSDLEEEIYMSQDEVFVIQGQENNVCKLRKSLYGLKQMIGSDYVIICLYVDDMLIFGPNVNVVNATKNFLSSKFEMKNLGEADVILGIKIKRTSNVFSLSRSHCIEKMLKRFNCFDVAPVRTPYDPSICLRKNTESSVS
ncbi:uncharacterized protein LOC142165387 [Nicotiana tabacum]|uniref:Uncharacterized protein LOC142165387 n=1 Tax=Nicotiana tabacum TaxID=4097 RepID=A0AC58S502_TOBAC